MSTAGTSEIKTRIRELGADLCGIASIERFEKAPAGFHPRDILLDCNSVVVMVVRFPTSALLGSSQAAYTFVRNQVTLKIDSISFQIASRWKIRAVAQFQFRQPILMIIGMQNGGMAKEYCH